MNGCLRACVAMVAIWLAGCTAAATLGEPITQVVGERGYRFDVASSTRHADDTLLILTFSGGGTRASALAYGVLEQLARDRVAADGRSGRLLDKVDVISAVSGGSVVAAYYGAFGEAIFHGFRAHYLEHRGQRDLWLALLASPSNWMRLGSGEFSRGDLFAEYLDRRLFHGATFADLKAHDERPFIVLNATDLSVSGRFEFTQDWFDAICTDLLDFPVARAVAASAALPVAITPITLRNRAGSCGYQIPEWFRRPDEGAAITRDAQMAARLIAYQEPDRIRYLHLVDGGVSDNLGSRAAIDVLAAMGDLEDLQTRLGLARLRRIAVITVNAAGITAEDVALRRKPPGALELASLSGRALIDQHTSENLVLMRELLERLSAACSPGLTVDTYWIDVDLSRLPDAGQSERLRTIPTGLTVEPELVAELICSGRELLLESDDYRRLVRDLGGSDPAASGPIKACPMGP